VKHGNSGVFNNNSIKVGSRVISQSTRIDTGQSGGELTNIKPKNKLVKRDYQIKTGVR